MKKIFRIKGPLEWSEVPSSDNFSFCIEGEVHTFWEIFDMEAAFKDDQLYVCRGDEFLEDSDLNYDSLARVLKMAYNQASEGKGKERHANGEKFEDQPIMTIAKGHGLGYQTGQAAKKLQEAHTLLKLRGKHAAIQEILGAINYAAAAVLLIEQMEDEGEKK